MVSTKLTYHRKRSFVSNYFTIFRRFCFSLRTSYKVLIWCTNDPNAHILIFCKCWSFIWRCFFPVSILKEGVQISLNPTLASYALFLVTWIKQNLFLFYFYMEKFDKNSFRAKAKGGYIMNPKHENWAALRILQLLVLTLFYCKDQNGQKL